MRNKFRLEIKISSLLEFFTISLINFSDEDLSVDPVELPGNDSGSRLDDSETEKFVVAQEKTTDLYFSELLPVLLPVLCYVQTLLKPPVPVEQKRKCCWMVNFQTHMVSKNQVVMHPSIVCRTLKQSPQISHRPTLKTHHS